MKDRPNARRPLAGYVPASYCDGPRMRACPNPS